jgi:bla regulator protein blaR1
MIIAAGAAAKAAVAMLAMMAAQGTLLAFVALLLARAGKLRPGWQAAVWLVVLAKLALPWGPAMPYSLADVIESLRGHGVEAQAVINVGAPGVAPEAPSMLPAVGWLVLAGAWAAGFAFVLGRAALAMHRARRAALRAPAAPDHARAMLGDLAACIGVRAPRLAVADSGAHVVGLLRPIIVVPPALLDKPALLRAALLHELAHVRRRDALGRAVQVWVGAMFFFWPIVRIVSRRLDLAREAACDASALEAGELSPTAYARLLVQMAALRSPAASLAMAHSLDARVEAVLGPPARRGTSAFHRVLLAAWVVVALGGARTAHAHTTRYCNFTPERAEALRLAHPEADLDGDGVLSREEACEFQAELRRHPDATADMVSRADDQQLQSFLEEPLCCNCTSSEVTSPSESSPGCEEGVDR